MHHNNIDHPVLFVRVDCPLEELERRERARGDRSPGQAKWQYEHFHAHGVYDIIVNTYEMIPEACADAIVAKLARPEEWKAFRTLKSRLDQGLIAQRPLGVTTKQDEFTKPG